MNEQSSDSADSEPTPYTTHEGIIANELRHIDNILSGAGDPATKHARAKKKLKELTQELEKTAWGETKPMDHVPSGSANKEQTDPNRSEGE